MANIFPSEAWLREFVDILNRDEAYARVAEKWEGSFVFVVEPEKGEEAEPVQLYMDLWHGSCRSWAVIEESTPDPPKADFTLRGTRANFLKVLQSKLDPIQAMLTRRLKLEGSLPYVMRNIPTVMEFVRNAQKVAIAGD